VYLRFNKRVTREEVDFFYRRYYRNCVHKKKMKFSDRIVIPLMRVSIPLGRFVVMALLAVTLLLNGGGGRILARLTGRRRRRETAGK